MNTFNKILSRVTLVLGVTCMVAVRLCADDWKEITYADPTIFVENGIYYLTGTRNQEPQGFAILESRDLEHWTVPDGSPLQLILRKGDRTYGEKGFWAPQYFKEKGTYYFTYTANEQTVIASSKSVFGPFRQKEVKPLDVSAKNIDSFLFKDDDGKYYLYHVRFNQGNYLWVAEFDIKKRSIKPETLKQCMDCTEPWEKTPNYKSAPVMEGPTVTKWDGVYYLFYSANHFMNVDYSVGYATASSPFGPWKKHPNSPIIHRSSVRENGSGHGDVFKGLDGKYYYVYHVHHSGSTVQPRKIRIVPLILEKGNDGLYSITVDEERVIKPMWK